MVVAAKRPDRFFDSFPVLAPIGVEERKQDPDRGGAPPLDWWVINNRARGHEVQHVATFPPELVVRPVLSMCPLAVCLECRKPVVRETETDNSGVQAHLKRERGALAAGTPGSAVVQHVGWVVCDCEAPFRPGVVLDPFGGSGTTVRVATGHGRIGIGIDLDPRNRGVAEQLVGPLLFEAVDASDVATRVATCSAEIPSGVGWVEGGGDASEESSEEGSGEEAGEESGAQGVLYEGNE
jgi:hypothetical protein